MPSSSMFVQNFVNSKLRAMSVAHLTCPTKSWSSAVSAYRRLYSLYPRTQSRNLLTGFAFSCSASSRSSSSVVVRRSRNAASTLSSPQFYQTNLGYGRFAYDEYASEESDGEIHSSPKQLSSGTLENVEDWQWKLNAFMRRKDEQEIVSREKKDRRDFEQLSALAARMGLHCRQYDRVVVFSKIPLPNYRSDLDTKRPQREVVLPFGLQDEVNSHLRAHLSKKALNKENLQNSYPASNVGQSQLIDEGFEEPSTKSVITERFLQRRSLLMSNKQRDWQESSEGRKMLDFRKSLPSHKEKETLLHAISQNQCCEFESHVCLKLQLFKGQLPELQAASLEPPLTCHHIKKSNYHSNILRCC